MDKSKPKRIIGNDVARFWSYVDKTSDCWVWTGPKDSTGYGQLRIKKVLTMAHRYSFELNVGPIPDGMELDHKCFNRHCVNPNHLRLVTRKQNMEYQQVNSRNKSGVKNVSWSKASKKWIVQFSHNNQKINGGLYDNLEEAARRADELRDELFTHHKWNDPGVGVQ